MKRTIRLRGISGEVKGRAWESESLLRAGRLASLEVVLDDSSVSRRHAEIRLGSDDWAVRDLGSTNGTYVNGVRIGQGEHPLRPRDIVQFGKVAVVVEQADPTLDGPPSNWPGIGGETGTDGGTLADGPPSNQRVVAAPSSYEEGLRRIAYDRNQMPRAGEQLVALIRAGHHFVNTQSEDQLLDNILNDAVSVLDAQRGAIVMAEGDGPEPQLRLRALAVGHGEPAGRFHYSKKLTHRAFARGESLLYGAKTADEELKVSQSMHDGAMGSVLCVLLRTPRRRLGVLHLDRGFWQQPFSEDDLHLADALAAHVSAAIESAQLLRKQKDLHLKTLEVLAQAVEMRDDYTGGHTKRVTRYAVMLAQHLQLPDDQLELVRTGTPLHDIGKIGIDDAILRKPGRLTPQEFALMQEHTTKGAEILSTIPEMHPLIPIVRSHHERWDGTGYPDRLAGVNIPLLARIVAVADAFDAMTSIRPYHEGKRAKPPAEAFAEVERMAGRQFDPRCAVAFLEIREQVVEVMVELMSGAATNDPTPTPDVIDTPDTATRAGLVTASRATR